MKKPYGFNIFEAQLHNDTFKEQIDLIRQQDEFSQITATSLLLERYNIGSWLWPVVRYYVETGEVRPELAQSPVTLTVDSETKAVSLRLAHDVKQPQLKRYIQDHYSDEIRPALDKLAKRRRGRRTVPHYPERDQLIYRDYKNGASLGKIASAYSIDERTASRIIDRKKKKAF